MDPTLASLLLASSLFYRPSLEVSNPARETNFTVGLKTPVNKVYTLKTQIGVMTAPRSYNLNAGVLFGPRVEIGNSGLAAEFFIGGAWLDHTTRALGSRLQFEQDLTLMYYSDSGAGIGFGIKHISNAGLHGPNLGRNYVGMEVDFPLYIF